MGSFFGKNCRYLRRCRRLSQTKVRGVLSISRTTFSNYENDITHPPAEVVALVASYFQVTLHELLLTDLEAEDKKLNYYYFLANNQTVIVASHQVGSMTKIVSTLLIEVAIIEDHLQNCT